LKKLLKRFFYFAAVGVFLFRFSPIAAPARAEEVICLPLDDMLASLVGDLHYAYLATAITDSNIVLNFYTRADSGWLILGIDNDLNACILAQGYDWQFALERSL
jgi:hypothetical protein